MCVFKQRIRTLHAMLSCLNTSFLKKMLFALAMPTFRPQELNASASDSTCEVTGQDVTTLRWALFTAHGCFLPQKYVPQARVFLRLHYAVNQEVSDLTLQWQCDNLCWTPLTGARGNRPVRQCRLCMHRHPNWSSWRGKSQARYTHGQALDPGVNLIELNTMSSALALQHAIDCA